MENLEILKDLEKKLSKIYEYEIEQCFHLEEVRDIVVFSFEDDDDQQTGLYSLRENKVIFEPQTIDPADIVYDTELHLISLLISCQSKIWIETSGKIILSGGTVLKRLTSQFFMVDKEYGNFDNTWYTTKREVIRAYINDDDENVNSIIARMVIDATVDEDGNYLMIETIYTPENNSLGIYDTRKNIWICENQKVTKRDL
jgi:hypothetical protein